MTITDPSPDATAMLLGPAVDVARRRGRLADPAAVRRVRASSQGESYVLMDASGEQLARVSADAVRRQLRRRRERAERVLRRRPGAGGGRDQWRVRLRMRSWNERALAWALTSGMPAPEAPFGGRQLLLLVVLLLLGVVPGLIYLGLLVVDRLRYGREMETLVRLWKAKGRPDPLEAGLAPLD